MLVCCESSCRCRNVSPVSGCDVVWLWCVHLEAMQLSCCRASASQDVVLQDPPVEHGLSHGPVLIRGTKGAFQQGPFMFPCLWTVKESGNLLLMTSLLPIVLRCGALPIVPASWQPCLKLCD